MAELEGRTLNRYELRRLIGKGGMANVYEGYDPHFQRTVAVKVFKREDDEMLRRFIREAELMASLHHPHLVEVYDTGDSLLDGVTRYYIVMPLLSGGTLRLRIRRSPMKIEEICQCLRDISDALDYIHSAGIVHRDIKASNVLLNDEGRCYLTDFGIARITTDATQLTTTGNVLGTVDYVAPELFEVHHRADALSDLYSLGVLLYEMVTGRLPFSADNQLALISMHVNKIPPSPRQFVPDLSPAIEAVISKALAKQPEARYASATELAEAFCQAASQSGIMLPGFAGSSFAQPSKSRPPLASPAVGALSQTESRNPPGARPSPLTSATEALAFPVQEAPLTPTSPDTPRPFPQQQQRSARRRPLTRTPLMIIIALLALLIVALPVAYVVLSHSPGPNHSGLNGQVTSTVGASPVQTVTTPQTAEAEATATAIAGVHATQTAVVAPSATAQARATATMGPVSTVTASQPTYQDSLTNSDSSAVQQANWDQNNQCMFEPDGYHILQPASPTYYKGCREYNNSYGNLALSVEVDLLSGHSGGVYFRLSTNLIGNYDGYLFEIDSQGNYKISRQQGSTITPLKDWGASSALHTGYGATNELQLIAVGNIFQFYANGHFLARVTDPANYYSPNGSTNTLGFLASASQGGANAEVVYSNLKVYSA